VDNCDVLVVGGGPAGSSCAWRLRRAGLDVVVMDKAVFPRDKVCAGWITPQVIEELEIDPAEYARGRTFQPITGFRVGVIGWEETVETRYSTPISFGIRRCEFDQYLLQRAGARPMIGHAARTFRRDGRKWIVDDVISARVIVGAGGHFCPAARMLNGVPDPSVLVAAQEVEQRLSDSGHSPCSVPGEVPELYFAADLSGYGWCFRKGDYVNVGFGQLRPRAVPQARAGFIQYLQHRHRIGADVADAEWHGHAYLIAGSRRRTVDDGLLLAGDAAGLAYSQSGEGIRPAIESGLMAASAILEARGDYRCERLVPYARRIRSRFGVGWTSRLVSRFIPAAATAALGIRMLRERWFVREVVLDRWFLHTKQAALKAI
jgi:geranylgeranyl reductase family protein